MLIMALHAKLGTLLASEAIKVEHSIRIRCARCAWQAIEETLTDAEHSYTDHCETCDAND